MSTDIDHTKTKAMSPKTNGICERFHKVILMNFIKLHSVKLVRGITKGSGRIDDLL